MCPSTSNQTPPASFAVTLHLVKLSSSSSALTFLLGRENPAQLFAATCYFLRVCQQPKILAVLLTPSSTCSLPERCIYNTVSKSSTSLTLPRKLLPSASQQSVTSTSRSNCNTVCSDIFKLTPVCPLIRSCHGCLKVTFSVYGVNKEMTFRVVLTLFRPDFMLQNCFNKRCTTGICYWSSFIYIFSMFDIKNVFFDI